jgi:hypothetical protein
MLALIIFGFGGGRRKDHGAALPYNCPNCHNAVMLHYLSVTKWFSLFFIPLIPYRTSHYLICPICTRALTVDRAHVGKAKDLVAARAALAAGSMTQEQFEHEVKAFWASVSGATPPGEAGAPPAIPPPPSAIPPSNPPPNGHPA